MYRLTSIDQIVLEKVKTENKKILSGRHSFRCIVEAHPRLEHNNEYAWQQWTVYSDEK